MATLHVRNVPDELYEGLRANAAVEGRSIGAQVVFLLQRALIDRASLRERVRERVSGGFGGQVRFLKEARRAVVGAQNEARELGHAEIGTEHLLLGLLREGGELAGLLARPPLALGADAVRARLAEQPSPGTPPGRIPFGADAKKALENALRESLALRHRHIGPEHVLLGIAAVEESGGAAILRDFGADLDMLRATVLLSRAEEGTLVEAEHELAGDWQYNAVELKGSEQDWTQLLNGFAREGWELLTIVPQPQPRAVFRRSATEADY